MKPIPSLALTALLLSTLQAAAADSSNPAASASAVVDVVVYGGTSAGVAAALEVAREGRTVVLISPDARLGGLSSGGLGMTDVGNPEAVGGMAREFYERIWRHYENESAWQFEKRTDFAEAKGQGVKAMNAAHKLMWVFEPSAAEKVFNDWVAEAGIRVVRARLDLKNGVFKQGGVIKAIRMEDGGEYRGRVFIDATYEGDLMAKAGVKYFVGREDNKVYGETLNGIQAARARGHQLPPGIDPYRKQGDPASGLLPGVNPDPGGPDGAGDKKIQGYCYRMCLTDVPENRIPIEKPAGYKDEDYEILFRAIAAGQEPPFFNTARMPNRKTDSNNRSGISTDYIGYNYDYPEADYAGRGRIAKAHENWQRGLLWTLQNHPRVPEKIRAAHAQWGLPRDEFTDNNHWSTQLYVREARRMIGAFVETENTLRGDQSGKRSIGMGSYTMDSHNTQRHVDAQGQVRNEGNVQVRVPAPYAIDYGAIVPKAAECENLLVPVCLSASHIAYGSIRMEPVFLVLGQSAGAAASIAVDQNVTVQNVPYAALRERLVAAKQILGAAAAPLPANGIIVDNADASGVAVTGNWMQSSATRGHYGKNYLLNGGAPAGGLSVAFTPSLPGTADYQVFLRWAAHANRADSVPVDIHHARGVTTTSVNQKIKGGDWNLLGTFSFIAGTAGKVVIRNDGATGNVVADAVMFQPSSSPSPRPIPNPQPRIERSRSAGEAVPAKTESK